MVKYTKNSNIQELYGKYKPFVWNGCGNLNTVGPKHKQAVAVNVTNHWCGDPLL